MTDSEVAAPPQIDNRPLNPYTPALIGLGAILVVVGFIILGVGVANNAHYQSISDDSGTGEIYLATPIITLGAVMFVGGLIVAAVQWILDRPRA